MLLPMSGRRDGNYRDDQIMQQDRVCKHFSRNKSTPKFTQRRKRYQKENPPPVGQMKCDRLGGGEDRVALRACIC